MCIMKIEDIITKSLTLQKNQNKECICQVLDDCLEIRLIYQTDFVVHKYERFKQNVSKCRLLCTNAVKVSNND